MQVWMPRVVGNVSVNACNTVFLSRNKTSRLSERELRKGIACNTLWPCCYKMCHCFKRGRGWSPERLAYLVMHNCSVLEFKGFE